MNESETKRIAIKLDETTVQEFKMLCLLDGTKFTTFAAQLVKDFVTENRHRLNNIVKTE